MLVEKNKTPLTMHSPTLTHHRGGRWQIGDSNIPPLRLYQVWKGRNKFIFGGRLIFGPDFSSLFITSSLIMVPLILFWAFVAKGLINTFPHRWGVLIIVLSVIFATYIIIPLFLTSGRDPGIIPRNTHPPDPDDCDSSSLSTDWAGSQNSVPGLPMTKSVMINGIVVKVKYCQTCMLYRPPRCSHCSICNNCVERFDHHCPWVGQCIGKRNYRYFFMFVSSTTLLCLYVLASCLINIKRIMNMDNCSIWRAIEKSPVSGILVIYTFVVCWFVGGLTAFHLYLIATNQTTYENFRYQYDQKMNPYNLGCSGNFKEVFFSKIPSSRNKFRAEAKENSSPSFIDSSYLGQTSPAMPKKDFDVETGKQQAIDADDSEDVRNRIGSFGRLERCGTFPRHDEWDQRDEITPDKYMFALELETKPCTKDKEKTNVDP